VSRPAEPSLRLRPYAPGDLEEIVALWHETKHAAFPWSKAQRLWTLESDRARFRDVVAVEHAVWIAEQGGRIAGFLAIRGDFVDQLFVRTGLQRRGVGTALLRKAAELSPEGLRLFTFQRNEPARKFYEKHGFRVVKLGTSPPPESEPDVEYRWEGPRPGGGR
jgi:ribosomal protein S18 acetylase RimI-like enzyme